MISFTNISTANILLLISGLFLLFVFIYKKRETLDAIISGNAFTDLRCLDDNKPVVRIIDSKTLQCLSKDGVNCLMRKDYGVPDDIPCREINGYLVKSIRDMNSPSRKVFNELENKNNYNLITCNPDGLKNSQHWCGQMWNDIKDNKCQTPDGKFGYLSSPCKQMPQYANSQNVGQNVSLITSSQIIATKEQQRQATQMARSRGRA